MYYERTGSGAAVQVEDTTQTGRILVIDDDPLFGAFAVTALESRGHDVDWTATVSDGLATLYAARYDLVIVDLQLPDGNGLELLRHATDNGLLIGSSSIILTGLEFEEPCDIRVFHKPVDRELEPFLDRIGGIIAITKRRRDGKGSASAARVGSGESHANRRRARVELVLYTSTASEKSQRALKTVQNVLREYAPEQVRFTVKDLSGSPEAGDEDAVVFTPTLVKRGPGSRTYIVGNLDDPSLVSDLLDVSGVKRLRD